MHIVHQYVPDHVGGTELYTQWLARGLRQRGHQVTVFFRRDAEGKGLECRDDAQGARICAAWSGRITPERRFLATFGDRHLFGAFQQVTEKVELLDRQEYCRRNQRHTNG